MGCGRRLCKYSVGKVSGDIRGNDSQYFRETNDSRFKFSDIANHNFTWLRRLSFLESSLQVLWANSQSNKYCSSPS